MTSKFTHIFFFKVKTKSKSNAQRGIDNTKQDINNKNTRYASELRKILT